MLNLSRTILELIADLGYDLGIDEADGDVVISATDRASHELFIVTADATDQDAVYWAVCELAELVDVDLRDG